MNRLVYLFELDSVRKYENPNENGVLLTQGLKAMFYEIIKRGNAVAITMNQLTDSQFIREALSDDTAYQCLLELFELGALRLSLFGNKRTASQYIQEQEKEFRFSNIPLDEKNPNEIEDFKNALRRSDLSFYREKMDAAKGEEKKRATLLYRFLNMLLRTSACETSNIPPKQGGRSFETFIELVTKELVAYKGFDSELAARVHEAVDIIKKCSETIPTDDKSRQKRSRWIEELEAKSVTNPLAAEIIHLCYNYTLEDSVNGASKHYDDNDFENTFRKDLINRFYLYCCSTKPEQAARYVSHGRWKTAVRFARYRQENSKGETVTKMYEEDDSREKHAWIRFMLSKNVIALGLSLVYILVFWLAELGNSWLEDNFLIPVNDVIISSLLTVVSIGVIGAIVDKLLKKFNSGHDMPDVLESIVDIAVHFCDFWRIFGGHNDSYRLP